jgi:[1-hydroxy-2-(trimethylamino)ethyl]phosphonate dioxygenase
MSRAWVQISTLYGHKGSRNYGLDLISQLDHALQGAALATAEGRPESLVVAVLLHDIGHLIHRLGERPADIGLDDHHEALGAKFLASFFGPEVCDPIRLHVAAKRYLCTTEPGYAALLSKDSVRSLERQGGRMSPAEVEAFRSESHWREAVTLRRYDDAAKTKGLVVAPLQTYRPLIESMLRTPAERQLKSMAM